MKTIALLTSPKLVDAVVQTIASDLLNLSWMDYVYHIAELGEDEEGDTYPMIYLQDGTYEYYSLLPDDSVGAFCFFTDNGFDIGFDGELNTYNLSLYVWAKLDNILTTNNDFTMDLVGDVLIALKDNECFNISVDLRRPFDEFTALNPKTNSNIMRRRTGFRIDFSVYGEGNICSGIDTIGSDTY